MLNKRPERHKVKDESEQQIVLFIFIQDFCTVPMFNKIRCFNDLRVFYDDLSVTYQKATLFMARSVAK